MFFSEVILGGSTTLQGRPYGQEYGQHKLDSTIPSGFFSFFLFWERERHKVGGRVGEGSGKSGGMGKNIVKILPEILKE